ncbi:MAG: hypothetical protein WCD76_13040 [Pyrinomonadaceae bacterium]
MRHKISSCACALACVSLWATAAGAAGASGRTASVKLLRAQITSSTESSVAAVSFRQDEQKDKGKGKEKDKSKNEGAGKAQTGATVSADEAKALKKIQEAKDASSKLQAGGEYVKKYPKSTKRAEVANYLAGQIHDVKDASQKVTLGETYLMVFNDPGEVAIFNPVLIDAYINAKRLDDAFRLGGTHVEKNPEQVTTLTRLALAGSDEASRNNLKYAPQSLQYGTKAIELIEADKKPENLDDAAWQQYRTHWLPELYRGLGFLAMRTNNPAAARTHLEKAVALKSTDPIVYAVLGQIAEDEYTALAKQYQTTHAAATFTQAQGQLDKVIEFYAQAMGLAGDRPEYKQLSDNVRPGLENYYKYRHNNSMVGLDVLIAKYKVATPATP